VKPWILLLVGGIAASGSTVAAQDFELELTEEGLNRIVGRLGDRSTGGFHQPNRLLALGFRNCRFVGSLECPTGQGAGSSVKLARCDGPSGQDAIVPAAEPVSWQWWITRGRFTIAGQQLQFSALVRYRVGDEWFKEERTVPATLGLDVGGQRLRMDVSTFKVPVQYRAQGAAEAITEVDVGRHMSFAIPIDAQSFQVTGLDGGVKTLTSRAQGASVEFLPGRVRVKIDATFN
jgi:hypothetical protein